MKRVLIYGNGSMARAAYSEIIIDTSYEVAAFTVDREYIQEETLFERPVIPFDTVSSIYPPDEYDMAIAVGYVKMNRVRAEIYCQAKEMGYKLLSMVSSAAHIGSELNIGDNCYIGPFSFIDPSARIGCDVIIGPFCMVGHDVVIEDHCFLASYVNLSGSVVVGPYCYFGPNVTVRNKVTIARECVLGAGAVILESTVERGVYVAHHAQLLPISSDKLLLN